VEFRTTPVDATSVPGDLPGFRLMFNSFHHLPPSAARALLADAVAKRQGIAVVELVERTPGGFVQMLIGLLVMLLATPLVRPFSLGRLLFTYVLPVVPLATSWDGTVSCLRIYSPDELRALLADVPGAETYTWTIEAIRVVPAPARITLLAGAPRSA
jgi:hypothetical protein